MSIVQDWLDRTFHGTRHFMASTADQIMKWGISGDTGFPSKRMDQRWYGSASTSYLELDASADTLNLHGAMAWAGGVQGFSALVDPGNAGNIPVTAPGYLAMVSAGAETRTLPVPTVLGTRLVIYAKTLVGNITLTATSGADTQGTTTYLFTTTGDFIVVEAVEAGANKRWRIVGATARLSGLSTSIADPGSGGTITALVNGTVPIVTAAAETRTLANPAFAGQIVQLDAVTLANLNNATVTVTNGFDTAGTTVFYMTAAGDFATFQGILSGTNLRWRMIAASQRIWDASHEQNRVPTRLSLQWVAGLKGKPGLAADIQTSVTTMNATDPAFEVFGTNAVSADTAYNAEGGITLSSHGADADQTIIGPHLQNTASLNAWQQYLWGTEDSVEWECRLQTGASIVSNITWAGLKLTNTPTAATDADQVYFRYQDAVNGGKWQLISSIGAALTSTDSGVTVVLSTIYRLRISINSSRLATFYINDIPLFTTAALTNNVNLIPYVGVAASGAAASKTVTVYGQAISRIPS